MVVSYCSGCDRLGPALFQLLAQVGEKKMALGCVAESGERAAKAGAPFERAASHMP
jgi:hypothetical protein